ncbi:hypothetical protein Tco_0134478, partial [Tanacetum coccineum]
LPVDFVVPLEVSVDFSFLDGLVSLLVFFLFNPWFDLAGGPSSLSTSSGFLFYLYATPLSMASSSSRIDSMRA